MKKPAHIVISLLYEYSNYLSFSGLKLGLFLSCNFKQAASYFSGPASALFQKSYYELMKKALKHDGILSCQGRCAVWFVT